MANIIFNTNFLRQLDSLKLVSGGAKKNYFQGERKDKRAGSGLEFIDYQQYQIGDDYRYIDWNLFSRLGELFTKLFIEEESLKVSLLIDQSASMSTGYPSKIDYACSLAAILGYIALTNLDEVEVVTFSSGIKNFLPPSRGRSHIFHLLDFFKTVNPEGKTGFNFSLKEFARRKKKVGLVAVFSDLLDLAGYKEGLFDLKLRGWEVILFHILEENELYPKEEGEVVLVDKETHQRIETIVDASVLELYKKQMEEFLQDVESFCKQYKIRYLRILTSFPFRKLIFQKLRKIKILK